jgi:hypothetical protein
VTAARQLGVLRDQRIQPVRLKHYQMKLLAPSIHQDTSFTAMCALDGHSMQLGLQQQPAGRVSSCTVPGPDSCRSPAQACQLQLRSLSGGMTVPCSTQLQTPALLPPGWLPCLPSQLPAAAAPCPLLLGATSSCSNFKTRTSFFRNWFRSTSNEWFWTCCFCKKKWICNAFKWIKYFYLCFLTFSFFLSFVLKWKTFFIF